MATSREELEHILQGYWQVGWPCSIDCGDGWNDLIADFHAQATQIDANYKLCQVKEKFGGLRIYFATGLDSTEMRRLAAHIENASFAICEITGAPGQLMRRNGVYKTLAADYTDEGWIPVY